MLEYSVCCAENAAILCTKRVVHTSNEFDVTYECAKDSCGFQNWCL
jgi:hypothetical protein